MKAIEQAIEARALKLAESRLEDERGLYEWALDAEITLRECAAAISALREAVKQEPVAAEPVLLTDAEIDAISLKQWGNQIGALAAAHRAYARAVEAEVIRRGGGQS